MEEEEVEVELCGGHPLVNGARGELRFLLPFRKSFGD